MVFAELEQLATEHQEVAEGLPIGDTPWKAIASEYEGAIVATSLGSAEACSLRAQLADVEQEIRLLESRVLLSHVFGGSNERTRDAQYRLFLSRIEEWRDLQGDVFELKKRIAKRDILLAQDKEYMRLYRQILAIHAAGAGVEA